VWDLVGRVANRKAIVKRSIKSEKMEVLGGCGKSSGSVISIAGVTFETLPESKPGLSRGGALDKTGVLTWSGSGDRR